MHCTALIFVFQRHSQLFSNSNFFLNELNMIDELLCSIASGRARAHFFDDCRSVYASTKAACCLWFCAAECFGRLLCVIANRKQHKKHIKEIFLKAMLFFSLLFRCRTNIYYNKQAKRLIGVCVCQCKQIAITFSLTHSVCVPAQYKWVENNF